MTRKNMFDAAHSLLISHTLHPSRSTSCKPQTQRRSNGSWSLWRWWGLFLQYKQTQRLKQRCFNQEICQTLFSWLADREGLKHRADLPGEQSCNWFHWIFVASIIRTVWMCVRCVNVCICLVHEISFFNPSIFSVLWEHTFLYEVFPC